MTDRNQQKDFNRSLYITFHLKCRYIDVMPCDSPDRIPNELLMFGDGMHKSSV